MYSVFIGVIFLCQPTVAVQLTYDGLWHGNFCGQEIIFESAIYNGSKFIITLPSLIYLDGFE